MSNNTFSTLSTNFSGALETGVDPRTGQCFMNLPLAEINANHLMGPVVSLSARYSTLSDSDSNGFGKGVSLGGVSFFNRLTGRLTLSNGESWPVDTSNAISDRRLKDCIFCLETTKSGGEQYILRWKNGVKEHLSLVGGNIYATSHIHSPIGKEIQLTWSWNDTSVLLKEIKDQYCGLCRFEHNFGGMTMTLWPESVEKCRFIFTLQDGRLSSIRRPLSGNEEMVWRMKYSLAGPSDKQVQLLTTLSRPTGMTDTVSYYKQKGLDFPEGSGLEWLPVVESHTKNYGGGQLPQTSRYRYSSDNFLGHNASTNIFGSWHSQSDYIYSILTKDYTYWSTETLSTENESVTVTRTYNNYHFLISEKTNRNGCETLTETEYYAEIGKRSKDQKPQYTLPMTRSVTFKDNNNNSRIEKTVTKFDEYGNPTYSETPDGTVTEYTYYPAAGEEKFCPAEPNGFVRFLREKVITPRSTIYKDTPLHTTKYTYSKLGSTHYHYVVQKTVSEYKDRLNMVLLTQRTITYQDDINKSEFGRITAITDTKYKNGENSEKFISRQDFTTSLNGGILNQGVIFTGHDGLKSSFKRFHSFFSGRRYREISPQGMETYYCYDELGRVTRRTLCKDTAYENITTWEYGIDTDGPYSIENDASGNKNKTHFDGAGRTIKKQRFDTETASWYGGFFCSYNSLGEVISGTVRDWVLGGTDVFPLKSDINYGGWGEKKEVTFSDGRKTLQQTDPIALTHTVYSQGGDITSGNITSILDEKSQLPIKKISQENIGGQPYSLSQYTWDGLGQLRQETDELGHITKRTYDEYGRVLTQTLADGTLVSRTYAPHLTGNQVASISVEGKDANGASKTWVLGTQTFDSLGRVTERVSGGRKTSYCHEGASPVAKTITLPSGKEVTHTYIPELGNVVSSMKADGITQTFNYDKKTGKPLTADEASAKIQNTWSQAGQLKEETFLHNTQNRTAKHTYTLKGVPLSYTDVAGKQTQYNMDAHGRVTVIEDDSLTVSLRYDALGRLSKYTVRSKGKSSDSYLTTELNYDAFGREITRTIKDNHSMTLELSQTWQKNGLLNKRTTKKNGVQLREEQYFYDNRNRLISYGVLGNSLPVDSYGQQIINQNYRYDALNNLTLVNTTLSDRSTNTATYSYQNASDPTQLTTLTNTHDKYPKTINLNYDAEGRMTRDEAGRTLTYDVMGRLTGVSDETIHRAGTYSYDAWNRLITRRAGNNDVRELYYRGAELVNEVTASTNKETRLIKTGHTCLGVSDDKGLTLTAGDKNDSLLWSEDAGTSGEGELHVWSPYGSGKPSDRLPGFNGERVDPVSGTYYLGNGYRAYNPVLMRFNCPDSLSPFGAGGINPYAYCAGDPINHTDPSGHLSWQAITGIVAGAIGLGLAVFTSGASIAAAGGVMAALSSASASSLIIGGLGVVADVTGIASGATENSNPEVSAILGWASLATGLAGLAGMAASKGFRAKELYRDFDRDLDGYRPRGIDDPNIVRVHRDERPTGMKAWHIEVVATNSGVPVFIYGSNRAIRSSHVEDALADLASRLRADPDDDHGISVLTGVDGEIRGDNWVIDNKNDIFRDPELNCHHFHIDDNRRLVENELPERIRGMEHRIETINMATMSRARFSEVLHEGQHIVLAHCYSRNDRLLRSIFGLPPVISYGKL